MTGVINACGDRFGTPSAQNEKDGKNQKDIVSDPSSDILVPYFNYLHFGIDVLELRRFACKK